jgi:hypothetical protein
MKIERIERFHVRDTQLWADVLAFVAVPAATYNLTPRFYSKPSESLVRLATEDDIATQLSQSCSRCGGGMRTYSYLHAFATQRMKPFLRNPQFRRGASPKQVGRRSRNNQEIRIEVSYFRSDLIGGEILYLSIDQQSFAAGLNYLLISEQQLEWIMRFGAAEVS